jgi:hypothetical protein
MALQSHGHPLKENWGTPGIPKGNLAAQRDRFHATLRLSIDVGPMDPVDPVLLGHCFSACVATRHAGASD